VKIDKVDLNKLRTFAAVAERGGVSGAARQLALTRSAVSQSLGALEASLGVQLFDRVGRRLVLTQEGRLLARRFERAHADLRDALASVVNEAREVRGVVRLGLFLGASRAQIARVLTVFASRHGHAQVKLSYGSHAELRKQLLEKRLDFALCLRHGRSDSPQVRSSVLFRQTLLLVSAAKPPRGPTDPDRLAGLPFIDYYPSSPLIRRWLAHHFPRKRITADVRVWAATTDMALELVQAGAGAAVLPRALAAPSLDAGRMYEIRGTRAALSDAVWLEEPVGAWRGAALEAFRTTLVSELGDAE
jgi:DNA-binding transcriptional LysR family regulator